MLPETFPIWATAQLLAEWWSDPFDEPAAGSPLVQASREQRSDPASAAAVAAAVRLGIDPEKIIALAMATDTPGLADEHERLFVGPGRVPCPPYESMWMDDAPPERGIMMGSAAGAVLNLYHRAGLTMRPHPGELPDHLVVETEALTWCLERNRGPAVAHALITEHLARWVPRFCAAVQTAARHPYYQALAELTPCWIDALAHHVDARAAHS